MPLFTTDALILRTYKLGESDRIVVFLTRDRGKKRGVAKNARQSRRRFGGALEPLTCGRVTYRERERRDLVLLEDVAPTRSPLRRALKSRPAQPSAEGLPEADGFTEADALGHVGYFAELIDEWAPDNDPNETLYRLGVSVVDALAAGVPVDPLARYFEYWLLRLQGVYERDARASAAALAFLDVVRTRSPLALSEVPVSRSVLRELETVHRATIALHLEKDLRSVRVLRELRR
jgi:DNA repair protein RecO (recombination protein O)